MSIDAYLHRIGIDQAPPATPSTLAELMSSHLHTVPFENLDIHLGTPISLDIGDMLEKLVTRRRGGFCYELNGGFAWLLAELGFDVQRLAGRVYGSDGGLGPPFDHMLLLVNGSWIADVGFGENHRLPIPFEPGAVHVEGMVAYRLTEDGDELVLERKEEREWHPQFRFDLEPHDMGDYAATCQWHQTSPESHFTRKRVATLARPSGRLTYSGTKRIETTADRRDERELSEEAWWDGVARELGIVIPDRRPTVPPSEA